MKNYTSFLESQKKFKLSYYAFDWDDNILHMPTTIHMDRLVEGKWHPISILPPEFALIRNNKEYRIRDNDPDKAYIEFKDYGPRGGKSFIKDIEYSLSHRKFGPSWNTFIKCLVEGSIFAIITARGHEYNTIKEGVKYVIDNCLSKEEKDKMYVNCLTYSSIFEKDKVYTRLSEGNFTDNELIKTYLNCCKYYGVGTPFSNSFRKEFSLNESTTIEQCKKIALGRFIEICNEYGKSANLGVSIGFSDDDKRNVQHVKEYFEQKSSDHINLKLNVFDTSDKTKSVRTKFVNGRITEYMGSELSNQEGSLLRFDAFNSQSRTLQNSTNDFTGYNLAQQTKVANGLYKKGFKTKKRILKKKAKKKQL